MTSCEAITMNKQQRIILVALSLILANAAPVLAQTESGSRSVESATWRFEFDNDVFFNEDNKISSGWSLQKQSAVARSWDALEDVPGFVRRWGKAIPTLTDEGLIYRAGIAISQVIQTPDDLSRSDLIEDDVPYAGALTLQATWYAFNDDEFRGFEITAGVVGPPSLAEQTQKTVHKLIGSDDPKGWDNQLSTEPVINFNYMRKQKVWRGGNPAGLSFDTAINGNAGLGNLFTQASVALEMRFGQNMPRGFVYVPDPIGLSMHYKATLSLPIFRRLPSMAPWFCAAVPLRTISFSTEIPSVTATAWTRNRWLECSAPACTTSEQTGVSISVSWDPPMIWIPANTPLRKVASVWVPSISSGGFERQA